MLVYKPKQHLKQQTGLKYLTNFEMANLKFGLTSQCHKTTLLPSVSCSRTKKVTCLISSN